jgi:hypothetical protein
MRSVVLAGRSGPPKRAASVRALLLLLLVAQVVSPLRARSRHREPILPIVTNGLNATSIGVSAAA